MPALNFKKQFAPKVESGAKRQTIRARREDGRDPKAGDTLFLYTGMRTKTCRKIGQAVCQSSVPILIDRGEVILAGQRMSLTDGLALARSDGFDDLDDFMDFFLPPGRDQFEGRLIKW